MKKIIYSLLAVAALTLSSCEDFTDLQPKGKNLLTTTDQLEMLLNAEVSSCSSDMRQMAGDMIYAYSNIATTISQPVKTRGVIIWTYDEASMDKMAELTSSDQDYSTFYGYIGTISNPILTKIDEASGSEAAKKQIKCEALALRAYSFYMLINKFAKAYDPSTAANTPGIILMTEDKVHLLQQVLNLHIEFRLNLNLQDLQTSQTTQLQLDDGVCLRVVKAELLHDGSFGFCHAALAGADGGDQFVHDVGSLFQTFQNVGALLGLFQVVLGAAAHHLVLKFHVLLKHLLQGEQGHDAHQREHNL